MSEKNSCSVAFRDLFPIVLLIVGVIGLRGIQHLVTFLTRPDTIVCYVGGCRPSGEGVYSADNPYRIPNDPAAIELCEIRTGSCSRPGGMLATRRGERVCAVVVGSEFDETLDGLDNDCDGWVDESEHCDTHDPRCDNPYLELASAP